MNIEDNVNHIRALDTPRDKLYTHWLARDLLKFLDALADKEIDTCISDPWKRKAQDIVLSPPPVEKWCNITITHKPHSHNPSCPQMPTLREEPPEEEPLEEELFATVQAQLDALQDELGREEVNEGDETHVGM